MLGLLFAYHELLVAYEDAEVRKRPSRANPLPIACIRRYDDKIMDGLLLWMLYRGHIEHLRTLNEAPSADGRMASVLLTSSSAFCLTDAGAAFAEQFIGDTVVFLGRPELFAVWEQLHLGFLVPTYDEDNRVFRWGCHVIKAFHQPAGNQELVLRAAEELGWMTWFDDPLPPKYGMNPKARLHDRTSTGWHSAASPPWSNPAACAAPCVLPCA